METEDRDPVGADAPRHDAHPTMRPRVIRFARIWAAPERAAELMRRLEAATLDLRGRHPDVPFRSYLGRRYEDDGACEIIAVSSWDTPEDMRQVLVSAQVAARPFGIDEYAGLVDRWELMTYEVFYPEPAFGTDDTPPSPG